MISHTEIEELARLSRLALSKEEVAELEKDIPAILEYVGQLSREKRKGEADEDGPLVREAHLGVRTIMREDAPRPADAVLSGKREALLAALPRREGDYAVVRKILQKDE